MKEKGRGKGPVSQIANLSLLQLQHVLTLCNKYMVFFFFFELLDSADVKGEESSTAGT